MPVHEVAAAISANSGVGTGAPGPATYPTVEDFSGNSYTGTMILMEPGDIVLDSPGGSVSVRSLLFGGTDEYVNHGDVLNFTQADSFSVSFWAKLPELGGPFPVLSKTGVGPPQGWQIYFGGTRQLTFRMVYKYSGPDDWYGAEITGAGISHSVWHHCVVTWNTTSGITTMYIDGVANGTLSVTHNTLSTSITNAYDLTIGRMVNSGLSWFTEGNLDDIAVYNKELSAGEVTTIYNGGVPTNLVGIISNLVAYWRLGEGTALTYTEEVGVNYAINATPLADSLVGAAVVSPAVYPVVQDFVGAGAQTGTMTGMSPSDIVVDSPGGSFSTRCLNFPAGNPLVVCPNTLSVDYDDPHSWSIWIKPTDVITTDRVIYKYAASRGFHLYISNNYINVRWENWAISAVDLSTNSAVVTQGVWQLITVTYDGSATGAGVKIYRNGVLLPASINQDNLTATILNAGNLTFGGYTGDSFRGRMDEISLHGKALSLAEVQWIYNSGVPRDLQGGGAPSNLLAYWRLGEARATATNAWMLWGAYSICGAEALLGAGAGVDYAVDASLLADSLGSCNAGVNYAIDSSIFADSDQTAWVFADWTLVAGCMADSLCAGDANMDYACWAAMPATSGLVCPGFNKVHHATPSLNPPAVAIPKVRTVPQAPPSPNYGMVSSAVRSPEHRVQTPIKQPGTVRGRTT